MNHFTYSTYARASKHAPHLLHLWVNEVPQLAISHDFLLEAIMARAAFDLHLKVPHDQELQGAAHCYFGYAFQALARQLMDDSNAEAVFAACILVNLTTFIAWTDQCWKLDRPYELPVQWLQVGNGFRNVLMMANSRIRHSSMRALVDMPMPAVPESATEDDEPLFENLCELIPFSEPEDSIALREALSKVREIWLSIRAGEQVETTRRRLMAFPMQMKPKFLDLVLRIDPRALVMLAYVFAAMNEVRVDSSWMHDRGRYEVNGIVGLLPPEYHEYVVWPLKIVNQHIPSSPGFSPPSEEEADDIWRSCPMSDKQGSGDSL